MITLYLLIATTKSNLEFQNERFNHDSYSNFLNTNNVIIDLDIMGTTYDKNNPIYLEDSDTIDINPDIQKNEYIIQFSGDNIIFNNREKQLDNNTIFFANGTEVTNNFKFIIKRSLNTYVQLNLALDGFSEQVIVEFECEGTEKNKHFLYNITSLDENQHILTDSGSCNDVELILNKPKYPEETPQPTLTPSPTKSYPPSPSINSFSFFSKEINLTSKGYINDTGLEEEVPIDPNTMNVININETDVTVYESSALQSESTLYFNATQPESTLTIDKNVNSSKIGIFSKNSPTVKLQKTNNPLSFYHDDYENEERVKLSTEIEGEVNSLILNDVNNRKGKFSLHCPDSIDSVSLSAIMMSIDAEFSVFRDKKEDPAPLEDDETFSEDVTIHVRDKIEIDSETKATLSNFNLLGKLLIHDDSQLTIKNDAIFNESSEIEFIISQNFNLNESIMSGNTKNIQPVISVLGEMTSSPSKVIVSSGNGGDPINVFDFPLIRTKNCSLFESNLQFGGGKSGQISAKCEDDFNQDEKGKVLMLTAVEEKKKKKKLSTGAIVGIAIAAVVVVALIIALIVFCVKKNKKIEEPSQDENVSDSVGF